MPIRSCEPTVVRCRWMASLARVIAVEKPMQYSVLRTDVIVHRLRDGDDLDAKFVELGRITGRVVTADGDQVFDAEPREVGQHLAGEVPCHGRAAGPVTRGNWDTVADEMM